MYLEKLILTNFKNYDQQALAFSPGINCFAGRNGMGKTNLLDAIYYLCMTKSYFSLPDSSIIRHEAEFMRLEAYFNRLDRREKVVAKVAPRKIKIFERNDIPYERLADHIGLLPVVFISPDDTELITEGSEARRRFLDNTLSQLDPRYLAELIQYNKILVQRNALLKQMADMPGQSGALLEVYDQQLLGPGQYLFQQRREFLNRFSGFFQSAYQYISNKAEEVGLSYQSHLLSGDFHTLLQQNQAKDRALQRTSAGIHRDDLECLIGGHPLKRFASQGQRKSFLLALKLAQFEILRQNKGFPPILLLDDLFDKLDKHRVGQLLHLLAFDTYGQVFLTDTQSERIELITKNFTKEIRMFHVEHGSVE